ncbi:N-acetylglucosaminyldiphosphodolichol N-acetylglucosaminyltransferase catalytic subunit alg13 [Tilletia horrida]|nr:N-acetylglucosaminyldiphosphodolichol N-acetylglucosaminyltransferase catalytic subunit alg13 [Tilletia horrida]
MKTLLVTVGSTEFDALVRAVLHRDFLSILSSYSSFTAGPTDGIELIVQYGSSDIGHIIREAASSGSGSGSGLVDMMPGRTAGELTARFASAAGQQDDVHLHLVRYTPDLPSFIQRADVVVAHAGSGTILEVLRSNASTSTTTEKKKTAPALVVVPNHTLMDDHQSELALALGRKGYLEVGHLHGRGRGAASAGPYSPAGGGAQDADTLARDAQTLGEQVRQLLLRLGQRQDGAADDAAATVLRPFPAWEPQRFARLVDDRLGF